MIKHLWNNKKFNGWAAIASFGIWSIGKNFGFGEIFSLISLIFFLHYIGLYRQKKQTKNSSTRRSK